MPVACGNGEVGWGGVCVMRKDPLKKRDVRKIARWAPGWPHRLAAAAAGSGSARGCWGSPSSQPNDAVVRVQVYEALQRGRCAVTGVQGGFLQTPGIQRQNLLCGSRVCMSKLTFISVYLSHPECSRYSSYYYYYNVYAFVWSECPLGPSFCRL